MISKERVYYSPENDQIVVVYTPKKYRKCYCQVSVETELVVSNWGACLTPTLIYKLCDYIGDL